MSFQPSNARLAMLIQARPSYLFFSARAESHHFHRPTPFSRHARTVPTRGRTNWRGRPRPPPRLAATRARGRGGSDAGRFFPCHPPRRPPPSARLGPFRFGGAEWKGGCHPFSISAAGASATSPPGEESCTGICCLSSCLAVMSTRAYQLMRPSLIPFQLVVILVAMCRRIFF